MRWLVIFTSTACLAASMTSTIGAASEVHFDRKAWQDDYTYLQKDMERRYANLAWFASGQGGVDIPALDRRTRHALAQAENDADAKAALLAFVAGFRDGHFSALVSLQGSAVSEKAKEPDKPAYDKLDAATGCAALGYAATKSTPFSLPFETLNGFALESDGVTSAFRAGAITTANGSRLGIVRIRYFRQHDYPALCIADWQASKNADATIDTKALQNKIDTEWFAVLADQLRRFKGEGVTAVIVDIGDNGGGNDAGDWASRLFTSHEVHSARLLLAAAPVAADYFDETLGDLRADAKESGKASAEIVSALKKGIGDFEQRKAGITAHYCDLSWVWREQREWKPFGCSRLIDAGFASGAFNYLPPGAPSDKAIAEDLYWPTKVDAYRGAWDGPVYVLTNGKTYSSAEMFAAIVRDNHVAKTVGTTTGGDGCGFMQAEKPVVLPHSRLRLRIPDCVRLRADGSDEVAGIQADLPLLPTEGESDRARAVRLLGLIDADLRSATLH